MSNKLYWHYSSQLFSFWKGSFGSSVGNFRMANNFENSTLSVHVVHRLCTWNPASRFPQTVHLLRKICLCGWVSLLKNATFSWNCSILLFSITSVIKPTSSGPIRSLNWFRRFSRYLSSTDNWFTSLVTVSTKSFVSYRLITAIFGVHSSSSVLVTTSRCNARFKTVLILLSLSLICFLSSILTWRWFFPSRNPLKTRWSLITYDSVG